MVTTVDLISYWKFDEASGTLADSHGSNDSIANTADYGATGIINDGLDYVKANSDFTNFGNIPNEPTDTISISMWVNLNINTSQQFIGKDDNTAGRSFTFGLLQSGKLSLQANGIGGSSSGSTTVSTGSLQHVGVAFSSTTGNGKYYLNGSPDGTFTNAGNLSNVAASLNIGRRSYSGSEGYTDGIIDEVALFDAVLSDSDFSDLYNSGAGLAYPFSAPSATLRLIKIGGSFEAKPILTKVSGSFVDKPIKIKVGGTFQDA